MKANVLSDYLFILFLSFYFGNGEQTNETQQSGDDDVAGRSLLGFQQGFSPCYPNPCDNGGLCKPQTSYKCECASGYSGSNCKFGTAVLSRCYPNPCLNGGFCQEQTNGITCTCRSMFNGARCENLVKIDTNPCQPNPCINNGVCASTRKAFDNQFTCICPQGYRGTICEFPVRIEIIQPSQVCNANPCKGDCQCTPSCRHSSGYYCRSPSGYLGKDCTIPPPTLICDPNAITVIVDDEFIKEYEQGVGNAKLAVSQTADGVATASGGCLGTFDGSRHTFILQLPFTQCGTRVGQGSDGKITFINSIWLNRIMGGGFDMPVPVINFECSYQKQYSIVTSLKPARDQPQLVQHNGKQVVGGTIELCKVPYSCPNACPIRFVLTQGAVYTVGEMIHLNINSGGGPEDLITLKDLSLTCDDGSSGADKVVVSVIADECPTKSMPAVVSHSGLSRSVCVSFQVPKLQNCEVFYIHAKLESCPEEGCAVFYASSSGGCLALGGRRRRDTSSDQIAYFEKHFGPIHVIDGDFGVPREILFPDDTNRNVSAKVFEKPSRYVQGWAIHDIPVKSNDFSTDTAILIVTIVGFCVLVSFLVSIIVYFRTDKEKRLPLCS